MRLGVIFPNNDLGADPSAVRDFVQTAEALGYSHLLVSDHVLGADPHRDDQWAVTPSGGAYTFDDLYHEVFVLLGYVAAITTRMELATGIVILPQRQTALVAKQAAEVDVLSGGRMRLGVGVGWNHVEYEGLGQNFRDRGRRLDEQVELLRRLWTEPVVDFEGLYHTVPRAGINPLPVQRPIPIWMGGMSDPVIRRVATYADGWYPRMRPAGDAAKRLMEKLRVWAHEAGRDISQIGIEGRVKIGEGDPADWRRAYAEWQAIGCTHITVETRAGRTVAPDPARAIDLVRRAKAELPAV
ncbi:MAG: LLM class F420-dependent oxidoreductase [Dehalococcoidia bacterium]